MVVSPIMPHMPIRALMGFGFDFHLLTHAYSSAYAHSTPTPMGKRDGKKLFARRNGTA